MKIVINKCYGGFGLSEEAYKELGLKWDGYGFVEIKRNDPKLVAVVKKLGERANGEHADLKIITIPDSVKWQIEEYDGIEWISEVHRIWS